MLSLLLSLALGFCGAGAAQPTPCDAAWEADHVAKSGPKTYGDLPECELMSVRDGDTFVVTVPGWPGIIGDEIAIRIRGINTPEMKSKRAENRKLAQKAKDFTSDALWMAKIIKIKNIGRDNFFRIDADVYVDGKSLADLLLKADLAKKYGEKWE